MSGKLPEEINWMNVLHRYFAVPGGHERLLKMEKGGELWRLLNLPETPTYDSLEWSFKQLQHLLSFTVLLHKRKALGILTTLRSTPPAPIHFEETWVPQASPAELEQGALVLVAGLRKMLHHYLGPVKHREKSHQYAPSEEMEDMIEALYILYPEDFGPLDQHSKKEWISFFNFKECGSQLVERAIIHADLDLLKHLLPEDKKVEGCLDAKALMRLALDQKDIRILGHLRKVFSFSEKQAMREFVALESERVQGEVKRLLGESSNEMDFETQRLMQQEQGEIITESPRGGRAEALEIRGADGLQAVKADKAAQYHQEYLEIFQSFFSKKEMGQYAETLLWLLAEAPVPPMPEGLSMQQQREWACSEETWQKALVGLHWENVLKRSLPILIRDSQFQDLSQYSEEIHSNFSPKGKFVKQMNQSDKLLQQLGLKKGKAIEYEELLEELPKLEKTLKELKGLSSSMDDKQLKKSTQQLEKHVRHVEKQLRNVLVQIEKKLYSPDIQQKINQRVGEAQKNFIDCISDLRRLLKLPQGLKDLEYEGFHREYELRKPALNEDEQNEVKQQLKNYQEFKKAFEIATAPAALKTEIELAVADLKEAYHTCLHRNDLGLILGSPRLKKREAFLWSSNASPANGSQSPAENSSSPVSSLDSSEESSSSDKPDEEKDGFERMNF